VETDRDFGHIVEGSFVNGDNWVGFMMKHHQLHLLYLWHLADSDSSILIGSMLQVLGVAVAADSNNVHTNCADISQRQKLTESEMKMEEEQSNFRRAVGGALVDFARNESRTAYAAVSKEL
jgi:hypothetical protein